MVSCCNAAAGHTDLAGGTDRDKFVVVAKHLDHNARDGLANRAVGTADTVWRWRCCCCGIEPCHVTNHLGAAVKVDELAARQYSAEPVHGAHPQPVSAHGHHPKVQSLCRPVRFDPIEQDIKHRGSSPDPGHAAVAQLQQQHGNVRGKRVGSKLDRHAGKQRGQQLGHRVNERKRGSSADHVVGVVRQCICHP